jgi:nucleoside-diphosphate-sugar epimerase
MVVEVGHPTTIYALPQVFGQQRTVPGLLSMTTAKVIARQVTCQTSQLPRVQRLGPSGAIAVALPQNKIVVMSDGTSWRPLINVKDMARAIDWAIGRPAEKAGVEPILNVGSNE